MKQTLQSNTLLNGTIARYALGDGILLFIKDI